MHWTFIYRQITSSVKQSAVFVAKTMYEDQKLLSIPADRIDILSEIYYNMNEVIITASEEPDLSSGDMALTLYVTVNSLTYSDGAEIYELDKKQKKQMVV